MEAIVQLAVARNVPVMVWKTFKEACLFLGGFFVSLEMMCQKYFECIFLLCVIY